MCWGKLIPYQTETKEEESETIKQGYVSHIVHSVESRQIALLHMSHDFRPFIAVVFQVVSILSNCKET